MKYAGLLKPPPQMTQEVYEFTLSQYAKYIVKNLKAYEKSLKNYRDESIHHYQPVLDSIEVLRLALKNEGTRKVFQAYRDFFEFTLGRFGYGYASEYKMKVFSGIKDKAKRESVKALVEENIETVLNEIEGRLAWGETVIPEVKQAIKQFRKLIIKGRAKKIGENSHSKKFSINLEGWDYFDHTDLDAVIEQRRIETIERLKEEIKDAEEKIKNIDSLMAGKPEEKKKSLLDFLRERKRSSKHLLKGYEKGDFTGYGSLTVQVDIGGSGNSSFHSIYKKVRFNLSSLSVETIPRIRKIKKDVHAVVVHEMSHVAQSLLSYITEMDSFLPGTIKNRGVPSKNIRTPQYEQRKETPGVSTWESHNLDDTEFYTDLRDAIGRIMGHINRKVKSRENDIENGWNYPPIDRKEKQEIFKHFIGQPSPYSRYSTPDPFFKSLKRLSKPKYNKAVGEAYKLIFNSRHTPRFAKENTMNRNRMIKRVARLHLEKNKWTETSNSKFDSEQQETLWVLYDIAYSRIGKHIGSKNELVKKYPLFEVIDHDEDPDIDIFIAMKKTPFGKKIAALGHDGSKRSKKCVVMKMLELLNTPGYYTEASDSIEKILRRGGMDNIKDVELVERIMRTLGKTDLIFESDGYYNRSLGSIGRHTKALFGRPIA